MQHEDIQLSGSLQISGSFALPLAANTSSISNPLTGSIIIDQSDNNKARIYNGTEWQEIASQSTPPPPIADIEYLVVAGGGGGGAIAGAGGAGGLLSSSLSQIEAGSSITVTVGGGGAAKQLSGVADSTVDTFGAKGVDSSIASSAGTSFTTVTALGGGAGGYYAPDYGSSTAKINGGSGGSMINFLGGGEYAGVGTTGQGNDGHIGTGASPYNTGGGGGAGADATSAGGGDGKQSAITGTSTYYAGGGGNSGFYNSNGQSGGQGGGADGAQASSNAVNATANTGGGGGGGGTTGGSQGSGLRYPSNGGSGVVILAYPTSSISATGGVRTFFNDRVAHTFESSGTFAVGGIKTYTHNTLDIFGDSSCIALYNLDGNANDKSGNYNGTASNVTYAQSYINQGGVFNGSSSYIYAASSVLSPTTNYSVSVWCKWSSKPSTSVGLVGNFKTGVTPQVGFVIAKASGLNTFGFWADGTATNGNVQGTTNFVTGQWYHVVGTYDGSNIKIYVDGTLEGTQAYTATPGTTDQPLVIGRWYGNYSGYYHDGQIDQVRIFNKALSTSEVATLYAE